MESYVDMFAVSGRGRAGIAVEFMFGLQLRNENNLVPNLLAGFAIETDKHAFALVFQAGGQKDAIAPNSRRGMPFAGDLDFPGDILFVAPMKRNRRFTACPIAARSTPP